MPDPAPKNTPNPFAAPPKTFRVSRAKFDTVPGRRAVYIMAYAAFIALVYGPKVAAFAGYSPSDTFSQVLFGAGAAAYVVCAYQLIRAMRIMGFEWWLIIGTAIIGLSAFPGPILVAYIDRKIATELDAADPNGGYRRPPPQDRS